MRVKASILGSYGAGYRFGLSRLRCGHRLIVICGRMQIPCPRKPIAPDNLSYFKVGPPGEDRGNGHRTANASFGFRLSVSRSEGHGRTLVFVVFGLREGSRITSGPAPSRRFSCLFGLLNIPVKLAPFPRGRVSKGPWECKVTPAYCACQERNTIGCISSNDRLDAGGGTRFSTSEFMAHSQEQP